VSLDVAAILAAVASHAAATGRFDRVDGHEPENAPGQGLSAAVWVDDIRPVPGRSGLASTSVRLLIRVRIYSPTTVETPDRIDPAVIGAADELLRAYSGDFTLGGTAANIDLLGAHGEPLTGTAGYLRWDGGRVDRVLTITVPIIVNDLYDQAP
jgi:hypothetical protein